MFKNKYQWYSQELKKKSSNYDWIMIIMALITLICLFILPQNAKMSNLIPLVLAILFWYLSYRTKNQDRVLKRQTIARQTNKK